MHYAAAKTADLKILRDHMIMGKLYSFELVLLTMVSRGKNTNKQKTRLTEKHLVT